MGIIAALCSLFVLGTSACDIPGVLKCQMDLKTGMTEEDMSDPCGLLDKGLACFGDCTDAEIDAAVPGMRAQIPAMRKQMGCDNSACSNVMQCILKEMPSPENLNHDSDEYSSIEEVCAANARAFECLKGCEDVADPILIETLESTAKIC